MKNEVYASIKLFAFLFISIVYLELVFKARLLFVQFDSNLMRILIFSLAYSLMIMFFSMFFKEKAAKIMIFVFLSVVSFLYVNQEIYHSFVEGFYSLAVIGDLTAGLSFLSDYITAIRFLHILYLLPIVSLILLTKYKIISFNIEYSTLKRPLVLLLSAALIFFVGLQTIDEESEESDDMVTYSDMDLYTYMYNAQEALKKFGLLTYTQRDFFSLFRTDPLSELEYVVLIDDYFESKPNHKVNNFTNVFEDKNLVFIMAESFDTFAINEELTPNLYKIKTENAYFENYYSPLYYRSTADTEFLVQTSMYPDNNVTLSMDFYSENTFPSTLPKLFEEKGYSTYSFHNYIDYFYPRSDFHVDTLGYDQYFGPEEMGMEISNKENSIILNHEWQSDLDMMVAAVPEFINDDKFFVNMLTVSGHFNYDDGHPIALKNVQEVADYEIRNDITLDEDIFYYLAANIELDKAVGHLFEQLEEKNKLEDTVIVIFGDHYAYGLDNNTIWEYDEMKEDNSDMDIHNVPLMIYSESTIVDGVIDNYISSIDFIPTLSNLFGLPLDYRLTFGNDALAHKENIVRFADLSFVSATFSYDSLPEVMLIPDNINPEYIKYISNKLINDYTYNLLVLNYDYFKEDEDLN